MSVFGGRLDGHGGDHAAGAHRPQDGEDFPVARRRALADARPSQTTGIAPCHLGGNTAFIQEYQLLRRDGADRFEELLTPLAVRFRIPLLLSLIHISEPTRPY